MKVEEAEMTNKEAIQNLIQISRMYGHKWQQEACAIAIKALEKQMPKKPIRIEYVDGGAESECPSCKKRICMVFGNGDTFRWQMPYCCDCGQKIDWEGEQK